MNEIRKPLQKPTQSTRGALTPKDVLGKRPAKSTLDEVANALGRASRSRFEQMRSQIAERIRKPTDYFQSTYQRLEAENGPVIVLDGVKTPVIVDGRDPKTPAHMGKVEAMTLVAWEDAKTWFNGAAVDAALGYSRKGGEFLGGLAEPKNRRHARKVLKRLRTALTTLGWRVADLAIVPEMSPKGSALGPDGMREAYNLGGARIVVYLAPPEGFSRESSAQKRA